MQCGVHRVQNMLGKKWSLLILEELANKNILSFNQIKKNVRGITQKILSERMSEFDSEKIVERIVIQERPLKVKYRLTQKGKDLDMVFRKLKEWGMMYGETPEGCIDRNCNDCVKILNSKSHISPLVQIKVR